MEDLKKQIIELFETSSLAPYTIEELEKELKDVNHEDLQKALDELKDEFLIHVTKKKRYGLLKTFGLYTGTIEVKEKGYGFIKSYDFTNEFFVPKNKTNGALNKDSVIFRITDVNNEESDEAEIVKVIKRDLQYVVGTINLKYYKKMFVPIDSKINIYFDITDYGLSVVDDVVKIKIDDFINEEFVKAHVVEVLGNINDVGIDIKAIAAKYDFYQEFDLKVLDNLKYVVNQYNNEWFNEEIKKRDKINRTIITVDGEDAKDLDDAISIVKNNDDTYELGVYIADVSFFVRENSALDDEAFSRGTSVYLVDRVIPMLPHKLSNDLCSLNEKTPKLVIACIMTINKQGVVTDFEIKEAVIETKHRMTYTNVNKIIEGDEIVSQEYNDIVNDIHTMNELAHILNNMRVKRGSLNFDIPEAKIIVDEKGKPIDIKLRERYDAEKLIEEFMLIANETVASCINSLELPFIYRIHDNPNQDKLKRFNRILKNTKYSMQVKKNEKITPKILQKLLNEVNEKDYALSTMLLRMMAKAKYDIHNIGHYGLASVCYTHFTSPIRRYPDLIVHRLLRKYLFNGEVSVEDQTKNISALENIALHSSQKERDAIECEYEVDDMKMAEYMEMHIGEEFMGTISSVTNFGMFVTLPNTIEGLVRVGTLKDDYYEYQENLMALVGKRTKKIYRLGDKVKVIVDKASKNKKEIDFIIPLKNNNNMIKYSREFRNKHEKRRNARHRKK